MQFFEKTNKQTNIKQDQGSFRDFPGGPVVKNPTFNAGDSGSIPGQGTKISHAAGQQSSLWNRRATTTECMRLN